MKRALCAGFCMQRSGVYTQVTALGGGNLAVEEEMCGEVGRRNDDQSSVSPWLGHILWLFKY